MSSSRGPFLVENKFENNHRLVYVESDDFNCGCSFSCSEHESLLKHLLRGHQHVHDSEINLDPSVVQAKWPRTWETFCEIRDKRKHYICKPLICDNKIAVKVEHGHPLADLMMEGYQLTPQKLDESVAERYEAYIPETGLGPVDIFAVKNFTVKKEIPPKLPTLNRALPIRNRTPPVVAFPPADDVDASGRRIYPLRRLLQRKQEPPREVAKKIEERKKDDGAPRRRGRPSKNSPAVEIVSVDKDAHERNVSKKEVGPLEEDQKKEAVPDERGRKKEKHRHGEDFLDLLEERRRYGDDFSRFRLSPPAHYYNPIRHPVQHNEAPKRRREPLPATIKRLHLDDGQMDRPPILRPELPMPDHRRRPVEVVSHLTQPGHESRRFANMRRGRMSHLVYPKIERAQTPHHSRCI